MQRSARKLVHPFFAVFAIVVACNGDSATGTSSGDPASSWSGDDTDASSSAAIKPALAVPANTIIPDAAGVLSPTADGSLTVDDRGQAHTHIPIWVPPGRAGIQPELSLEYSSGGSNGLVGVGWGLAGLSRITRCANMRKNGNIAPPILWNEGDTFCLDGDPLVPDSDHYFYRRFHDDGSRILRVRSAMSDPGWWMLYAKDGRITTFGGTADSKVMVTRQLPTGSTIAMTYAVSRVEDRAGNYMTVTYVASVPAGGEIQPSRIDYTGSATDATRRSLTFTYESRPDIDQRVVAEQYFSFPQRLKSIAMHAPNSANMDPLRTFTLGYTPSAVTGRSLLKYLAECDGSAPTTLPVSGSTKLCRQETLTYAPGTTLDATNSYGITNFDSTGRPIDDVTPYTLEGVDPNVHLLDVDGDGHDDLLYLSNDAGETYHLRLWTGNAFGPAIVTDIAASIPLHLPPLSVGTSAPYVLDFNGDGHADVLVNEGTNEAPYTMLYLANNASGSWTLGGSGYEYMMPVPGTTQVADLNGDGWPDLVSVDPGSTTGASYEINRDGNVADLTPPIPLPISRPDFKDSLTSMFLDVNNDGVTDIVTRQWSDSACVGHKYGDPQYGCFCNKIGYAVNDIGTYLYDNYTSPVGKSSLPTDLTYCTGALDSTSDFSQLYGDFNGDGLIDVIETNVPVPTETVPNPPRNFQLKLGGGQYSFTKVSGTAGLFPMGDSPYFYQTLDADGDGKTDLLVRGGGAGSPPGSFPYTVWSWKNGAWHNTVLRLTEVVDTIPLVAYGMFATGDVDGDGQSDYVAYTPGGSLVLYTRNSGGPRADLLTDLSGDFVRSSGVKYQPYRISASEDRSDCKPPIACVTRLGSLVSELDIADGAGGTLVQSHTYASGRADMVGWGFLGFKTHTIKETSGIETVSVTTRTFDFTANTSGATPFYPLLGHPVEVDTTVPYLNGTQAVTRTTTSTTSYTVQGTGPFMALPHVTQTTTTDSNSNDTIASTITSRTYDIYGNVMGEYVQWPLDLETKVTSNQYLNDTNNWLIGLPIYVTTTSSTNVNIGGGTSLVRSTAYAYDALGQLALQTDNPGTANGSGGYDPLASQSDGVQTLYTRVTRDAHGLPTLVEKLDNPSTPTQRRATANVYDASESMYVIQTTDPVGLVTQAAYEPGLGVVAAQTDPAGMLATFQYDTFGRIRADHPAPGGGRTVAYQAATSGNLGTIVDHRSGQYSIASTLDLLRRTIVSTVTGRSDSKAVATETTYDALGRVHLVTRPHFTNASSGTTTTTYDMLNRPVKVAGADGSVVTTSYVGLQVTTTNVDGNLSRITSDTQGRPLYSEQATTTGTAGLAGHTTTTMLTYGPFNTLASSIDTAGNEIDFGYDRLGRALWKQDHDSGVTAHAYNVFGEVSAETLGARRMPVVFGGHVNWIIIGGIETDIAYDGNGRVRTRTTPDLTQTATYDTVRPGKLSNTSITGGPTISYTYITSGNGVGNVKTKSWAGPRGTIGYVYAYDAYNRLSTTTYPVLPNNAKGLVLRNTYYGGDLGGQLTKVDDITTSTTVNYWTLTSTDPSEAFPIASLVNGVQVTLGEDSSHRGWLSTIVGKKGTTVEQSLRYTREGGGRVHERDDLVDPAHPITETFGYDGLERLTSWSWTGAVGARGVSYIYDDLGNLAERNITAGPGTSIWYGYAGPGPHQATSDARGTAYAYDEQGNELVAPGRTFTWNSFERPITVTSSAGTFQLAYDADLSRFSRTDPTGHTRYSYGSVFEEFTDGAGTHDVMTINAGGRTVGEKEITNNAVNAAKTNTLLTDALGSIDTIVTSAGRSSMKYDPFGARVTATDPTVAITAAPQDLRAGFTGHDHDDDVNLIDMIGRVYDPVTQRFLSVDPPAPDPVDSQAYNPYAYVRNNPLNSTDPTGYLTISGSSLGLSPNAGLMTDSAVTSLGWGTMTVYVIPYGSLPGESQGVSGEEGAGAGIGADASKIGVLDRLAKIDPVQFAQYRSDGESTTEEPKPGSAVVKIQGWCAGIKGMYDGKNWSFRLNLGFFTPGFLFGVKNEEPDKTDFGVIGEVESVWGAGPLRFGSEIEVDAFINHPAAEGQLITPLASGGYKVTADGEVEPIFEAKVTGEKLGEALGKEIGFENGGGVGLSLTYRSGTITNLWNSTKQTFRDFGRTITDPRVQSYFPVLQSCVGSSLPPGER